MLIHGFSIVSLQDVSQFHRRQETAATDCKPMVKEKFEQGQPCEKYAFT